MNLNLQFKIAYKDKIANKDIRYGSGGKTQFVCFDFKDENEHFKLMPGGSAPKLDGFIQGPRYRIKSETDDDSQVLYINVNKTADLMSAFFMIKY